MADLDDLQRRVVALEALVLRLSERVTDTHTLAAHADRDVAGFRDEVRVQTQLINVTREDVRDIAARVFRMEAEQELMTAGLGRVESGQQLIIEMLRRLTGDEQQ